MQKYETLELQIPEPGVATVILDRPQVHNAMNGRMIEELTDVFEHLARGDELRLVCLKAHGRNFCAGADLNWMKNVTESNYEDINSSSVQLYNMFDSIKKCRHPVLTIVQGKVYGGGLGLLAASDYVIADQKANFCFSELKLGLIPATISPFIIDKIGYSFANALFLSAKSFDTDYAYKIGLIHEVSNDLNSSSRILIDQFMKTAPQAAVVCKKTVQEINSGVSNPRHHTASIITNARLSPEGQEGMKALLEKREPKWAKKEK